MIRNDLENQRNENSAIFFSIMNAAKEFQREIRKEF